MGKAYWLFVLCTVGLFGLVGLTGSWNMFGNLPSLPFMRQVQPSETMLNTELVFPDQSQSTGFTAAQLLALLKASGVSYSWERTSDQRGWILRTKGRSELTGTETVAAMRMDYLENAYNPITPSPGLVVTAMMEDGVDFGPNDIDASLFAFAGLIARFGLANSSQ